MTPESPPTVNRRPKYTTRACWDCRQRKVKCSGQMPCLNCQAREVTCTYYPRRERGSKGSQPQHESTFLLHGNMNNSDPSNDSSDQINSTASLSQPKQCDSSKREGDNTMQGDQNSSKRKRSRLLITEPEKTNTLSQCHSFPASIDLTMSSSKDSENIVIGTSEEEMNTFDLQVQAGNSISLSSQLMSLSRILGARSNSPPPFSDKTRTTEPILSLQLPNLELLQDLIEVFFRDMNFLLPILNQNETIPRITRTLKALGYNERTGVVSSCADHAVFLGIILYISAIADTEAPDSRVDTARLGWDWFQKGQQLSKYFAAMKPGDLDRVCYYTLGAVYLLRLELLSHASAYVMQAWNAATVTGMNDQSSWPRASYSTTLTRQKLWWALYYLDTHVARRRGRPYFIRDSEVAVTDFVPQLSILTKHTAQEFTPVHEHPLSLGDTGIRDMEYYQTSANFGHLWKQIWDTLFSAKRGHYADAQDVEILDARILYLERITPSSLKWKGQKVFCQQNQGESEIFVRRRLLCQLQLNLYRMIIRQNPLRRLKASLYDKETCAVLARENISMCAAYIVAYPDFLRPAANILTLHLSESIYHLTYSVCDGDADLDASAITESFKMAYGLVKKLARSFHGSRKALNAITTSYCALKRTAVMSNTLGCLVDFISREHEAMINGSSNGETMTTQQNSETSNAPLHFPNIARTPISTNDETGLGTETDQIVCDEDFGLQWPVIGSADLGVIEGFSWPELELGVERDVVKLLGHSF